MRSRRYNPRRVKALMTYTVNDLAKRYGVHRNTIRHWQQNGLAALEDGHKPRLFRGTEVRRFLIQLRKGTSGRRCQFDEFFCLSCKEPQHPAGQVLEHFPMTRGRALLRGSCEVCRRTVTRIVSGQTIGLLQLRYQFTVKQRSDA